MITPRNIQPLEVVTCHVCGTKHPAYLSHVDPARPFAFYCPPCAVDRVGHVPPALDFKHWHITAENRSDGACSVCGRR